MQFHKISIPTPRKVNRKPKQEGGEGGEGSKSSVCKGKYEAKTEFSRGGGGWVVQSQDPSTGGVWIVSGTPHCCK